MKKKRNIQCEGWRRYGGAFTFGPVKWEQCRENATVMVTIKQGAEDVKTLPACDHCLRECQTTTGIKVKKVEAI